MNSVVFNNLQSQIWFQLGRVLNTELCLLVAFPLFTMSMMSSSCCAYFKSLHKTCKMHQRYSGLLRSNLFHQVYQNRNGKSVLCNFLHLVSGTALTRHLNLLKGLAVQSHSRLMLHSCMRL